VNSVINSAATVIRVSVVRSRPNLYQTGPYSVDAHILLGNYVFGTMSAASLAHLLITKVVDKLRPVERATCKVLDG
jgi:hypothetical protein